MSAKYSFYVLWLPLHHYKIYATTKIKMWNAKTSQVLSLIVSRLVTTAMLTVSEPNQFLDVISERNTLVA